MNSPQGTARFSKKDIFALAACAIFLLSFMFLSWAAWLDKCATFDEPLHLIGAWIQTHDNDFRCNPEDPPLWKYYIALGTSSSDLKVNRDSLWPAMLRDIPAPAIHFSTQVLYQTPGNDADKVLRAARARMLVLGVLLGATIAWWAWRLAGPWAAVIALGAFSFDPNFLAHSLLVKNDVAITLVFLLLMAAVFLLGERATLLRCVAVLLLVAIALTTKFSGLLAFPMLAIALLIRVLVVKPWPVLCWNLTTRSRCAIAAATIFVASFLFSWLFIWACYGFRFSPTPNPAEQFDLNSRHSQVLSCAARNESLVRQNPVPLTITEPMVQQWVNQWRPSFTVRIVESLNRLRLLPQSWLYGFLYTYATALARRSFLCGQLSRDGWWYYFPLAMIFKTPLATLAAIGAATIIGLRHLRRFASIKNAWPIAAVVVGPTVYFLVAIRSNLNIGLRHIFPVYPFLFIFVGVIFAHVLRRRPKITATFLSLLFAGLLIETLASYPDYIPFFNAAVGGSRGGLALLSDSNIDWGQDLPALAAWQRQHPDRQLYLSQFASPDPRYYGLHYIQMPGTVSPQPDETTPSGLPPVYAISAVSLQETYTSDKDNQQVYSHFTNKKPVAILNNTIYLFDNPVP